MITLDGLPGGSTTYDEVGRDARPRWRFWYLAPAAAASTGAPSARFRYANAAFRLPPSTSQAALCARLVAGSVAGRVAMPETPCASGCPGGETGRHSNPVRCRPRGRAGSSPAPGTPVSQPLTRRYRRAYRAYTYRVAGWFHHLPRGRARCSASLAFLVPGPNGCAPVRPCPCAGFHCAPVRLCPCAPSVSFQNAPSRLTATCRR